MDDEETATIELTRNEAREVINALSSYRSGESGRDERRALNVEEFLQREFGFENQHFDEDRSVLETFADIFDEEDGDEHEIQLSRAEAEEVVSALADHEEGSPTDAETAANLRDRFEETFSLDARSGV